MKSKLHLSTEEAIILQQVHEDGEDDAMMLAYQLGMSRPHTVGLVARLRQKGLLKVEADFGNMWVSLSERGKKLVRHLWPEARQLAS